MRSRGSLLPLLGTVCAVALGGCVDMFTSAAPPDAEHWRGVTTAGVGGGSVCGPFALDVDLFADPIFMWQTIDGRAYPAATPDPDSRLVSDRNHDLVAGRLHDDGQFRPIREPPAAAHHPRRATLFRMARHP